MTALAADKLIVRRGVDETIIGYPVATNAVIYKGAIVAVNASGFLIPATDTAGLNVVGIAERGYDNTGGANGAAHIRVVSGCEFLLVASSITQAMLGDVMSVVDDNTVDDAAGPTNDIPVGKLTEFVSTTSGYVFIPAGGN